MSAKSYIVRVVIFTFITVLIVLGWNYVVDPYAITGAKRIPGFNQHKVDINNHTRLSKKYQPLFRQHNALIIGNSRVEMGINPGQRCFILNELNVYNLGMPGASVRTQLEYALNVMYQQPIEKVLLSLDFTDFLSAGPQLASGDPDFSRLSIGDLQYLVSGQPNPGYLQIKLLDYYKSLFSLDALTSSVKTVVLQSNLAADREDSGFNPARDFANAVRIEGPRALFSQKMHGLKQKYSKNWYLRNTAGRLGQSFEDIDKFLSIAAERDVEVYLFTNPFHVSYWNMLKIQGLMPMYEDWIQSIEELVRAQQDGSVTFWDFSQDSPYIHEEVPGEGVKSGPLSWFWEPAHYREELGSLMIDAMFSESCNTPVMFGQKVY